MVAQVLTIPTALTAQHDRARSFGVEHVPAAHVSSRASATPQATRLRLTRRGRVVFGTLTTLAVVAGLAIAAMFGGSSAVASSDPSDAQFGYVIVEPGASLWQVASQLDSSVDPRDLVAEIVRLNQLQGSSVQAGQPVAVPLRYAGAPGVVSAAELGI